MSDAVAILGTSQTEFRHHYEEPQPELVRRAASMALADAQLELADVDAVVYSMAPDAMIGVMHPERWVADAAGAIEGRPILRVNTGGATGLSSAQLAYHHVASGLFRTVLVVGAERVGESGDAQMILNRIWDPFYERPFPLNTVTMLAMQAVRFADRYGTTDEDLARVSVKNHRHGARNCHAHIRREVTVDEVLESETIAYPLRFLDLCPQSSGAAAMVLANADVARTADRAPAWINGVGVGTETYWIGDRMGPRAAADHAESPALASAVESACARSGIGAHDLELAELYAPFSSTELHAIPDAGLCESGDVAARLADGEFDIEGRLPVNPSGGVMCSNPIAVTAMVRAIECALQVTGTAGGHQVHSPPTHALATGIGGDHEFFAAMAIGAEPRSRTEVRA